jgi:hypothetical protein
MIPARTSIGKAVEGLGGPFSAPRRRRRPWRRIRVSGVRRPLRA